MSWTTAHDVALCREILVLEPYRFKIGSRERGQCWDSIAENLSSLSYPKFSVDQRAVRDRFSKLERYFRKRMASEERASGISPEMTELDEALENIIEMMEEAVKTGRGIEKKREENEKQVAENVRKRSMETLAETLEREKEGTGKKKKRHYYGSDTIEYLKEKNERGKHFMEKKLELKERELEVKEKALKIKEKEVEGKLQCCQREEWQNNMLLQLEEKVNFLNQQQQQQHIILQEIKEQNAKIMNLIKQSSSDK